MSVTQLEGKVALVTGAGRGIGRAIAVGFAEAGAAVCCLARTRQDLESAVSDIEGLGGRAMLAVADVRDGSAVARALNAVVEAFGGLDVLVVNAGVSSARGAVDEVDPTHWRETVETNLVGAFLCVHEAVPHLKARGGGKIITIGSGLGHNGRPTASAYAASKAGLWMLTRVLAQELLPFGITVNELIPGPVATTIDGSGGGSLSGTALGEFEWVKSPEDVVPLAMFMATLPERGPTAQSFSLMRRDV